MAERTGHESGGIFAGSSAPSAAPSGRTGFAAAVGASAFPPCDLALVIVEARYERIHAALMLAATACALGQSVVLFGMGAGVAAFTAGWDGLEDAEHETGARLPELPGCLTCGLPCWRWMPR